MCNSTCKKRCEQPQQMCDKADPAHRLNHALQDAQSRNPGMTLLGRASAIRQVLEELNQLRQQVRNPAEPASLIRSAEHA